MVQTNHPGPPTLQFAAALLTTIPLFTIAFIFILLYHTVTNLENSFLTILVLWFERMFYGDSYWMEANDTDLGDKLGHRFGDLVINLATLLTKWRSSKILESWSNLY
ncbi:hypothetical protein AVEN_90923-1 [Araneus ventricosus]|uniref:Uncharacterized protein n=1 Tax=Araneus ventricosus TaxID=182803 RepID=A0A4Y2L3B0_ARAVE|nr:hypothetical protein AVEN_90923-1 [Araneus ventricosus]